MLGTETQAGHGLRGESTWQRAESGCEGGSKNCQSGSLRSLAEVLAVESRIHEKVLPRVPRPPTESSYMKIINNVLKTPCPRGRRLSKPRILFGCDLHQNVRRSAIKQPQGGNHTFAMPLLHVRISICALNECVAGDFSIHWSKSESQGIPQHEWQWSTTNVVTVELCFDAIRYFTSLRWRCRA